MKVIQCIFFSKILPRFEFEVNYAIQSYDSLTREDTASLQITYHSVHYLKYTEKAFLDTEVGRQNRYTGF